MAEEEIYVALLDEGVDVWRPAPAWKIDDSTYIILRPDDYDPDDEKWEFPPGSTVICEPKAITDGTILAAVRQKELDRQSA
ncbi:MAG TPA: hypothetical protein VGR35_07010 [Tepidisphaeraceae bacterium]|nr:hypothetical protein [Tepidisphaeraceae bacterium]